MNNSGQRNSSSDLSAFIETLRSSASHARGEFVVARAPGRLDVMGGIADYSGSLVLQRPIAEATFAALRVIDEPVIQVVSVGSDPKTREYSTGLSALAPGGAPI